MSVGSWVCVAVLVAVLATVVCVRLVRVGTGHGHCCRDDNAVPHTPLLPLLPPRPTRTGENAVVESERAIARISHREVARRKAARNG